MGVSQAIKDEVFNYAYRWGRTPRIYQYGNNYQASFTEEYIGRRGWCAQATVKVKPQGLSGRYRVQNEWLSENASGRWDRIADQAIEFENKDDAVLFKLVWCGNE